jgi:hypothetical protein
VWQLSFGPDVSVPSDQVVSPRTISPCVSPRSSLWKLTHLRTEYSSSIRPSTCKRVRVRVRVRGRVRVSPSGRAPARSKEGEAGVAF